MDQIPARVETITDYLFEFAGVRYSLDANDDELDRLPFLLAKLQGPRELSEEEFEGSIENSHPGLRDFFRADSPRKTMSDETHDMVVDASLLWGEIFRQRYPQATWRTGAKPRNSIDYGWPVLVGHQKYQSEFNTYLFTKTEVFSAMLEAHSNWTLGKLTHVWAHRLGLGPDPNGKQVGT
jgi:hypothetical protein